MKKESKRMAKLFNLKDLPAELKYFGYSQDHVLGLREAIESGDPKIARQTLNNTMATTRAQNTFLGFKEFGNQRRQLIKDFNATPSKLRGPIIEKLNALSEEFIPGKLKYYKTLIFGKVESEQLRFISIMIDLMSKGKWR